MRASWFALLWVGCVGTADLGRERSTVDLDASRDDVDAAPAAPAAADGSRDSTLDGSFDGTPLSPVPVTAAPAADPCSVCFDLTASVPAPQAHFALRWDDGSTSTTRRVCPSGAVQAYSATLVELASGRSASSSITLAPRIGSCGDAGAADAGLLCLMNQSFNADATPLPTLPTDFSASPWLACGSLATNFPRIIDDAMTLPLQLQATDGQTYLSLANSEQVAQQPCAPVLAGKSYGLKLDLAAEIGGVTSDMVGAALELWGGRALDCSQLERLWISPPLTASWQTFCATLMPQQAFDNLTLRAVSTNALPYPGRVQVDRLQPVSACP